MDYEPEEKINWNSSELEEPEEPGEDQPVEEISAEIAEEVEVTDVVEEPKRKATTRRKKSTTRKPKRVSKAEEATPEPVPEEVKREAADINLGLPSLVAIVSCWPGRLILRGCPSGNEYVWEKAGDVLQVVSEDVPFAMSKNDSEARGCCGSQGGRIYFDFA